jgi:hypothetical protein
MFLAKLLGKRTVFIESLCRIEGLSATADNAFLEEYNSQLQELFNIEEADLGKRFAVAVKLAARFQKQREKAEETLEVWLGWWRDALLLASGSDGLVVVGTTGESPTVTWEEEHQLFKEIQCYRSIINESP